MQITIDLATTAGEGSLEHVILDRAAAKVAGHVDSEIRAKLTRQIAAITEDELRGFIRPKLADAMASLLQPTDSFGTPKGEPQTLQQVIIDMAAKELRKPTDRYDSRSPSVLQKLIHEEVQRTIRGELQTAMKEAREEVLAAVRGQAAKIVTDTIARIGNV